LAKTGLPTQKLVLYCRPTFHEQFNFLRERVIDKSVLGWILGPPGTGKSTTALAFASTLDRKDWIVTWIHLDRADYPVCVRLEGDSKKSREIYDSNIDDLFDILEEVDESKQHIVFIDGYTLNGDKHIDVQKACYSWLKKDREKRRLVIVCSMSSRKI
jgi:KaiC/GvpD/RAD55 family RecA-like ATPase